MAVIKLQVEVDSKGGVSSVKSLGDETENTSKKVSTSSEKMTTAFKRVGVAIAGYLAVRNIVNFGQEAVRVSASFEKSMSNVKAVTGATGKDFEDMTKIAIKMGATTQFTASQAANALEFLGLAGLNSKQSVEALPGVLNLAAAGNLDLATAADLATNVLSGMNKPVSELSRVNDVLAYTSSNANTNITELGAAFRVAGPLAASAGQSLETTAAILGGLANRGIKAENAGQGLSQILIRLQKAASGASDEIDDTGTRVGAAAGILEKYSIQVFNAEGKTRDLADILRETRNAGLSTSEMIDLFGAFTVKTASAAVSAVEDIDKLKGSMTGTGNAAEGASKKMADIKLDNFTGDTVALSSAWEALLKTVGDVFTGQEGREFIQELTQVVRELTPSMGALASKLSDVLVPVLDQVLKISGEWAAILDRIQRASIDNKTEFDKLSIAFYNAGRALEAAQKRQEAFLETNPGELTKRQNAQLERLERVLYSAAQAYDRVLESVRKVNQSQREAAEAAEDAAKKAAENAKALEDIGKKGKDSVDEFAKEFEELNKEIDEVLSLSDDFNKELEKQIELNLKLTDMEHERLKAREQTFQEILKSEKKAAEIKEKLEEKVLNKIVDFDKKRVKSSEYTLQNEIDALEKANIEKELIEQYAAIRRLEINKESTDQINALENFKKVVMEQTFKSIISLTKMSKKTQGEIWEDVLEAFILFMVTMATVAYETAVSIEASMALATSGLSLVLALLVAIVLSLRNVGKSKIPSFADNLEKVFDSFLGKFDTSISRLEFTISRLSKDIISVTQRQQENVQEIGGAFGRISLLQSLVGLTGKFTGVGPPGTTPMGVSVAQGAQLMTLSGELAPDSTHYQSIEAISTFNSLVKETAAIFGVELPRELENTTQTIGDQIAKEFELIGDRAVEMTNYILDRYAKEEKAIKRIGGEIEKLFERQASFVAGIDEDIVDVQRRALAPEDLLTAFKGDVERFQAQLQGVSGDEKIEVLNRIREAQLRVLDQTEEVFGLQSDQFVSEQQNTVDVLKAIRGEGISEFDQMIAVQRSQLEELIQIKNGISAVPVSELAGVALTQLSDRVSQSLQILRDLGTGEILSLSELTPLLSFFKEIQGVPEFESPLKFADGGMMGGSFSQGQGIFSKPSLGLIAEAGQPEAVVPLRNGREIPVRIENKTQQQQGGTTVHVTVGTMFAKDLGTLIDEIQEDNRLRNKGQFKLFVESQNTDNPNLVDAT